MSLPSHCPGFSKFKFVAILLALALQVISWDSGFSTIGMNKKGNIKIKKKYVSDRTILDRIKRSKSIVRSTDSEM